MARFLATSGGHARSAWALAAVALLGLLLTPLVGAAAPAKPKGKSRRAVVLVFARGQADPNVAVRIERDLRNMYDYTHELKPEFARTLPIETRFDVGYLSKGEIEKARMHFNDAQRALEGDDADEANDQLFRAQRFYTKAIPYSSDTALLRGIFFYYYLARLAAGKEREALEAYCAYVALTRNLAGSAGPMEQFEPLADKCGETTIAGTGELRVTANVDGAHVYVDGRAVGVIGQTVPYANPFISAGPHLVEVRKAGYVRWGDLVSLANGKSQAVRAQLKPAKNRADDYDPLNDVVFEGEEAFSEAYISDLLFQMADRFGTDELVVGYLDAKGAQFGLTIFSFSDSGMDRFDATFNNEIDAHRAALSEYWKGRFGEMLDPADALPSPDRFAPTLFRVE